MRHVVLEIHLQADRQWHRPSHSYRQHVYTIWWRQIVELELIEVTAVQLGQLVLRQLCTFTAHQLVLRQLCMFTTHHQLVLRQLCMFTMQLVHRPEFTTQVCEPDFNSRAVKKASQVIWLPQTLQFFQQQIPWLFQSLAQHSLTNACHTLHYWKLTIICNTGTDYPSKRILPSQTILYPDF